MVVAVWAILLACTEPAPELDLLDDDKTLPTQYLDGDCDPLVPTFCAFPFPSNAYMLDQQPTVTGYAVNLPEEAFPTALGGQYLSGQYLNQSDGFSASGPILAHLPGATTTGLADPEHIEDSLLSTSPTVVMDAATGDLIAHFAELDMSTDVDDERAFIIRPVVRLRDNARYIVAIRNVVDELGQPLEASSAFAALRDDTDHEEASVDLRRELYADIFQILETNGITTQNLQLAWDFNTASRANNADVMLQMRDTALALYQSTSPKYEIDDVVEDYDEDIAYKIEGRVTVPLFLDDAGPGGILVEDDHGDPQQNGTAEYPFVLVIPYSALEEPADILQYGHGIFGSRDDVLAKDYLAAANELNYVLLSMDWIGMSDDDVVVIVQSISNMSLDAFRTVPDRTRQGFVNMILAGRMLRDSLSQDSTIADGIQFIADDPGMYYIGGSQGGIYGTSLTAISPDIERSSLLVGGQSYSLMMYRSVVFDPFFQLLGEVIDGPMDVQLMLGLAQMMWDRAEPSGYSPYIIDDPLPGTPSKDVYLLVSIGDHQVPNLSSQLLARSIGVPNLAPVHRSIYGMNEVNSPAIGSAYLEVDFGLPDVPLINLPMREGNDPHDDLLTIEGIPASIDVFFRTGVIEHPCGDQPCSG